jgi:hypothetical protein
MIIHSLLLAAAFAAKAKMLVVLENERQKDQYATVLNQLNEKFETYYKLADDGGSLIFSDYFLSPLFRSFTREIWQKSVPKCDYHGSLN